MPTYYKGFDKNLQCRGFQFEIGKTYETETAKLCDAGFHACENPLDIFDYYPPNTSRYAEVVLEEVSSERGVDSKVCAKKITVVRELAPREFAEACASWFNTVEYTESTAGDYDHANTAGAGAHANTAGTGAHANTAGDYAHAGVAGQDSIAVSLGENGTACAKGDAKFIVLTEHKDHHLVTVKVGRVGVDIEAGKIYRLQDGVFVESVIAE